jgi:histidine triad (HIT) family protein
MTDCIFCKIVNGDIPSSKVYEDSETLAFLDISPVNKGHTLIIPKKHYETFEDVPADELGELIVKVQKVCKAVIKATNADGYNLIQNNKTSAGQEVPHIHFHIIPRYKDDGFKFNWENKKYEDEEMKEFKEKISKEL